MQINATLTKLMTLTSAAPATASQCPIVFLYVSQRKMVLHVASAAGDIRRVDRLQVDEQKDASIHTPEEEEKREEENDIFFNRQC